MAGGGGHQYGLYRSEAGLGASPPSPALTPRAGMAAPPGMHPPIMPIGRMPPIIPIMQGFMAPIMLIIMGFIMAIMPMLPIMLPIMLQAGIDVAAAAPPNWSEAWGAGAVLSADASFFCMAPTCADMARYLSDHSSSLVSEASALFPGRSSTRAVAATLSRSFSAFSFLEKSVPPCGLTATHLLSIMWLELASITLSTGSFSTNLTKAKPLEVPSGSRLMSTLSTWPNLPKWAVTLSSVVLFLRPPTKIVEIFSSFSCRGFFLACGACLSLLAEDAEPAASEAAPVDVGASVCFAMVACCIIAHCRIIIICCCIMAFCCASKEFIIPHKPANPTPTAPQA
mmetsp:Transcript_80292/g.227389  ORF Transcript_80292/g.227389 Transcript_80292/m.227389 type:complete len:340 (+) Transcript_80292:68-1087(+)